MECKRDRTTLVQQILSSEPKGCVSDKMWIFSWKTQFHVTHLNLRSSRSLSRVLKSRFFLFCNKSVSAKWEVKWKINECKLTLDGQDWIVRSENRILGIDRFTTPGTLISDTDVPNGHGPQSINTGCRNSRSGWNVMPVLSPTNDRDRISNGTAIQNDCFPFCYRHWFSRRQYNCRRCCEREKRIVSEARSSQGRKKDDRIKKME